MFTQFTMLREFVSHERTMTSTLYLKKNDNNFDDMSKHSAVISDF